MEERAHLEVAGPREEDERKPNACCGRENCSLATVAAAGGGGEISMPICFLVKEQAKSLVAIQELQKRVESIENIQDDVIDSLAEIRKYLCNESRTYSGVNLVNSSLNASNDIPSGYVPKLGSFKYNYSPSSVKETKCSAGKEYTNAKPSLEHSQKQFESKNKESALESDKQDSGLDSDHVSLNRHSINNYVKQESGDELLQLLEEISERTEVLQKQLAVIDQNSAFEEDLSNLSNPSVNKSQFVADQRRSEETHTNCLNCSKTVLSSATGMYMEEGAVKSSSDESREILDGKRMSDHTHKIQKRVANKIDSAMVSSILKETNVVDLQRQVLIYLVENAVLNTKLGELEKSLSSKSMESDKMENSLKDETRLLMMENRELRISLDEQRLETNSLRSKVLMLERVLQSISVENRELTWQLGESLGIQNLTRKEPRKFSSSYSFGNSPHSKFTRKSSLPCQFVGQNETNVNCVRSKLLSNASSFLDVTVEEPEHQWHDVQTPAAAFQKHEGPVHSSTPLAPFTKLKDVKAGAGSPSLNASNFQSVKKRFKSTEKDGVLFKNRNSDSCPEVPHDSELYTRNVKFNSSSSDESAAKFPFNSILEKLKANSDNRILRRTSLAPSGEANFSSDASKPLANRSKHMTPDTGESAAASDNLRQNSHVKNLQSKKGKNIHQRIQDILDRIMSESEEAT